MSAVPWQHATTDHVMRAVADAQLDRCPYHTSERRLRSVTQHWHSDHVRVLLRCDEHGEHVVIVPRVGEPRHEDVREDALSAARMLRHLALTSGPLTTADLRELALRRVARVVRRLECYRPATECDAANEVGRP